MIDRRAFLHRLGFGTVAAAAAATGVFDVEKILWVPGEKRIFIPPPPTIAALEETLSIGDIFTIGGRYAINPITRKTTDVLQQFVVTATIQSGEYLETANSAPRPFFSGPYRNVSKPVESLIDGREVTPLMTGKTISMIVTTQ